jgi:hypothetical protein
VFGHDAVHVLDGGLPAWISAGGELEAGEVKPKDVRPSSGLVQKAGNLWMLNSKGFQAALRPQMVRTWRQVRPACFEACSFAAARSMTYASLSFTPVPGR